MLDSVKDRNLTHFSAKKGTATFLFQNVTMPFWFLLFRSYFSSPIFISTLIFSGPCPIRYSKPSSVSVSKVTSFVISSSARILLSQICLHQLLICEQISSGSLCHNVANVDEICPVAELQCLSRILFNQKNRCAILIYFF